MGTAGQISRLEMMFRSDRHCRLTGVRVVGVWP